MQDDIGLARSAGSTTAAKSAPLKLQQYKYKNLRSTYFSLPIKILHTIKDLFQARKILQVKFSLLRKAELYT
jgi:hypothetical protein